VERANFLHIYLHFLVSNTQKTRENRGVGWMSGSRTTVGRGVGIRERRHQANTCNNFKDFCDVLTVLKLHTFLFSDKHTVCLAYQPSIGGTFFQIKSAPYTCQTTIFFSHNKLVSSTNHQPAEPTRSRFRNRFT
jgi:hypothetical protein